MKQLAWIGTFVALMACGKAKDAPPATGSGSGSAPAKVAAGSGSGSSAGSAAKPAKKTQAATAADKKTFREKMKAGWAAQKDKKWADAVVAFEAALAAIPNEARALAELGWSAMNAGDYKKAKVIDEQAVATALDKKVKASGLYNLGQVLEKLGDKPGALRAYAQSITLRPNKTVEAAILALGADPAQPPEPWCKVGLAPCDCLKSFAMYLDPETATCAKDATTYAGDLRSYTIQQDGTVYSGLFDAKDRFVTELGWATAHARLSDRAEVKKVEVKKVGAHSVLWIELLSTETSSHLREDAMVLETEESTVVDVCLLGDDATPPSCPLTGVPIKTTFSEEVTYDDDSKPGTETKRERALSIALGDDGATVKLETGSADDLDPKLLGPHKLW